MYKSIPVGINFKIFVKETNEENPPEKVDTNRKYFPVDYLTGDKAKEFYEDVVKGSTISIKKDVVKTKDKSHLKSSKRFKNSDLLQMAQNNDVKNMEILFTNYKNYDVNIVDEFGWTPLMCAACSGALNAILLLVENGADINRCDKSGETALSLARKNKQLKIVEVLEEFKPKLILEDEEVVEETKPEIFFCSICKENIEVDKSKHESSTVHLFNSRIKTSTFYGIPESNKGFQLLLRKGWNKEKGLGRDETGRKFPIKAVMKKDRMGIGAIPPDKSQKRQIQNERKIYKKRREKDFEKNFRLERTERTMENPTKSLKYLEEMEKLGEEILTDRQEIIALDKRRNETREGLRELRNVKDEKTWFAFGPLLVKYSTEKIEEILKKDQMQVDAEINKLRSNLKIKVNDLRDMEHKPPVPGLMLNAMSPEEMKAVGQVLGRHAN